MMTFMIPTISSYFILVTLLILFSNLYHFILVDGIVSDQFKPAIVLNAFDEDGYDGALWFIESLKVYAAQIGPIYLFYPKGFYPGYSFTPYNMSNVNAINYPNDLLPLPDLRIAKVNKHKESVTKIIYSWNYLLSNHNLHPLHSTYVISLGFHKGSIPVLTSNFDKFNDMFQKNTNIDLFLLSKTKKLTSLSDWHDLSIVAFNIKSPVFQRWWKSFTEVYFYYASNRQAFSLLDPRFAIMEANAIHKNEIKIKYFGKDDICSVAAAYETYFHEDRKKSIRAKLLSKSDHKYVVDTTESEKFHKSHHGNHHYENSRCEHIFSGHIDVSSAIQLLCGSKDTSENSKDHEDTHSCLVLHPPHFWKKRINYNMPGHIGHLGQCSNEELYKNPQRMMWKGLLRFKNTSSPIAARPFCWENSNNVQEELLQARMNTVPFHDKRAQPLFTHPDYDKYRTSKSNISAVIMTGSEAEPHKINKFQFLEISKMYYAKRHGYDFSFTLSNEYLDFLPKDLFKAIQAPAMQPDYFRGIMTKPLMILDTMYKFLHKEWIVWTDDDVYINPGWTYMPLDVYLADIPKEKVVVMANYRSGFTNALAFRNTAQGRKLMIDWVAITFSGYIQCHGYDQASLAALLSQRIGSDTIFSSTPLNFTCIYNHTGFLGCNDFMDWSCDFKMERALYRAGFKTARIGFHNGKISSFSKGCANEVIPEFHVVTETERRPRLQCGLCTRITEIESAGHWDGPLGGGNLPLLRGKINNFFFNHKSEWLFYDSYLKDRACLYVPDVVPKCEDNYHEDSNHVIISLTDGYGFDIDNGIFCEITNKKLLERQNQDTYMKDYPKLIETIAKIPESEWQTRYFEWSGGEGRVYDPSSNEEDKQRPRRRSISMYERENYCETCRKVNNSPYSLIQSVVDCRTVGEEAREIKDNVNMD